MRSLLTLLLFVVVLPAQCFDVLQILTPDAAPGEDFAPEVTALLRLRVTPSQEAEAGEISWRAALVSEAGKTQGPLELRIHDRGSAYECLVQTRAGRRRMFSRSVQLDAKGFTLVECGWHGGTQPPDALLFRRVAEDAPFELPDIRSVLMDLTEQLLPAKPPSGMLGRMVSRVRETLNGGAPHDTTYEAWLAHMPLARLLSAERRAELLTQLASQDSPTTTQSAQLLRCALSDASVLQEMSIERSANWHATRPALRAGWAGSDDPAVRGAFGYAAACDGDQSVPLADEGLALHAEVHAGLARLPGQEAEQAEALARLDALARATDASPALTIWAIALVGVAALLWGTRRWMDRVLAS
jgi:hypothetical protein